MSRVWTYGAFSFFILLGFGAWWAIGSVYSSAKAVQLIDSLTESGLYLASASAGASATILALMLTLLGMIRRLDAIDFDDNLAAQVKRISKFATLALMMSLILLLLMAFPVGEYDKMPARWNVYLFNVMFAMVVLVLASLAMTVASLYLTVSTVISGVASAAHPDEDE